MWLFILGKSADYFNWVQLSNYWMNNNKKNSKHLKISFIKPLLYTYLLLLTFCHCQPIFYPSSGCLYNLVSSRCIKLQFLHKINESFCWWFLESDINYEFKIRCKIITTSPDKQNIQQIAHHSLLPHTKLRCGTWENATCCSIEKHHNSTAVSWQDPSVCVSVDI